MIGRAPKNTPRLDELAKAYATNLSRREVVKSLLATAVGLCAGDVGGLFRPVAALARVTNPQARIACVQLAVNTTHRKLSAKLCGSHDASVARSTARRANSDRHHTRLAHELQRLGFRSSGKSGTFVAYLNGNQLRSGVSSPYEGTGRHQASLLFALGVGGVAGATAVVSDRKGKPLYGISIDPRTQRVVKTLAAAVHGSRDSPVAVAAEGSGCTSTCETICDGESNILIGGSVVSGAVCEEGAVACEIGIELAYHLGGPAACAGLCIQVACACPPGEVFGLNGCEPCPPGQYPCKYGFGCCPCPGGFSKCVDHCCPSELTCCVEEDGTGTCAALSYDSDNCQFCGVHCESGTICCNGQCIEEQSCCYGKDVDLLTDPANCGSCGNKCENGQTCSGGMCIASGPCPGGCPPGSSCCVASSGPALGSAGFCVPDDYTCCQQGNECQPGAICCPAVNNPGWAYAGPYCCDATDPYTTQCDPTGGCTHG